MLGHIIKLSFMSLILIILVHYLYIYFTSLLTTPKVKDLVFVPSKKYDELYELIKKDEIPNNSLASKESDVKASIDMKSELKKYLNNHMPQLAPSNTKLLYTNI